MTPQLLQRLGVPPQRAQCILQTLGQGAELDEADEAEGELDTATMDKLRNAVIRTGNVADMMPYRQIAAATFNSSNSQALFVDAAWRCRGA